MTYSVLANFLGVLALLLLGGKLASRFALRCKQPAVLGELCFGMLMGTALAFFQSKLPLPEVFAMVAEAGVMLLLFEVGLETRFTELRRVGARAAGVAVLGVAAPLLLGVYVSIFFQLSSGWIGHLFLGATLSATSVGITARVLKDLGQAKSPEASVILAAAVIDDLLGLVLLGLLSAAAAGATSSAPLWVPAAKACVFLLLGGVLGAWGVPRFVSMVGKHFGKNGTLLGAFIVCLGFSFLAGILGLAPPVGAFFAGLWIDSEREPLVERGLKPFVWLFVPLFFVITGVSVDLSLFAGKAGLLAIALSLVAVAGKLVSGGLAGKGVRRLVIGVGMIPRGEVGLIFVSLGAGLSVLSSEAQAAAVGMVAITTFLAPVWLARLYRKGSQSL